MYFCMAAIINQQSGIQSISKELFLTFALIIISLSRLKTEILPCKNREKELADMSFIVNIM